MPKVDLLSPQDFEAIAPFPRLPVPLLRSPASSYSLSFSYRLSLRNFLLKFHGGELWSGALDSVIPFFFITQRRPVHLYSGKCACLFFFFPVIISSSLFSLISQETLIRRMFTLLDWSSNFLVFPLLLFIAYLFILLSGKIFWLYR